MESIRVGNNKFIAIVKAGEVYLVVAVGKDDVTLLTQLTEEQLSEVRISLRHKTDFRWMGRLHRRISVRY